MGLYKRYVQSHFHDFRLQTYVLGVPELFVVPVGFEVGVA